jgi:hypothetical protein
VDRRLGGLQSNLEMVAKRKFPSLTGNKIKGNTQNIVKGKGKVVPVL